MRVILLAGVFYLALTSPSFAQVDSTLPRVKLPVSFVLDTTLVSPELASRSAVTGLVVPARRGVAMRLYAGRGSGQRIRYFGGCPTKGAPAVDPAGIRLTRLRTDGTWVRELAAFSYPCVRRVGVLPKG